jgi:starch phosphorylase
LRFVQEYFLVACSLADLVRRFRRGNSDWNLLPEKVAIQLNDTHPSMAVPELMRILLDEAHLGWDQAWDLTQRTLAYTNHTLLPEALEKWPVAWFEMLLPRHLEIIDEINRRLLDVVRARYPGDEGRVARVSLIEEGPTKHVRMANLAIVGSHSTNGVAAIHTKLLRTTTVKDLAELFPERFSNKTNGVTPRRWLLLANPMLARTITETIGDDWITDLSQLSKLKPLADEKDLRLAFSKAKREAKAQFATWLRTTSGQTVDAETIFDCQIKRIHEYKRQLLNVLRIVVLYNRLRANPSLKMAPRTFFFAGKAAPAYHLAKVIIKFINNLAHTIDSDPVTQGKIKVLFLPEYDVTLAERLIPASDVSNQISTAGYEASGTSNMKFMMNGALTIGTRDGATIEMAEEAGEDNFFLFGLTAEQVASSRDWYNPRWHYEHDSETRAALDLIFSDFFSRHEPGVFAPLRDVLLTHGDYYMHLADLKAYLDADQRLDELYADPHGWARKVILNVAGSGKFSSDRTIAEYAADIWKVAPCPVIGSSEASAPSSALSATN